MSLIYELHSARNKISDDERVVRDAAHQNSMLDAFAADAAILLSLLLQHGAPPAEIGYALRRSPNGAPASLIGAVVDELHATERQQDRKNAS